MPRRSSEKRVGLSAWLGRVFGRQSGRAPAKRQALRRQLRLESLEGRTLMATDLAAITGQVFKDITGNGFTVGEQVAGATVNLFKDDGDGIFEPGAGDLAPPAPILSNTLTDAQGNYRFENITAGSYWVQQPAQTVGSVTLLEEHVLVTVSSTDAQGTVGTTIDTFTTPIPTITATLGSPAAGFGTVAEALGGQRDLFAQMTAGGAIDSIVFEAASNQLNINPSFTAVGRYVASWDGVDNNALVINPTGLGGVDLTNGGASTGIVVRIGVDKSNASGTIRLYTDATHFSDFTIAGLPDTSGSGGGTVDVLFPYASFTPGAGAAGGATFNNIGAIEFTIEATQTAMDGAATFVGTIGPTLKTANFDNFTPADLQATKQVDNPNPNVGDTIQYTITATNNGPSAATGVIVTDPLPAGVTFVSSNASVGSYSSATGIWTIGNLAVAASATLTIQAVVNAAGVHVNAATVTAEQTDENPNNNRGEATIDTPEVDIAVTKTVDDSTPNQNQNVTFTVTATNNGPDAATGVQLTDQLPAGLTFVSAAPQSGTTYDSATGVWTIGSLASGATRTMTIVATVVGTGANGSITNVATLTNVTQVDSTPGNNQASAIVTPNQTDLAIVKTVDDATPDRNQNVTFTLTVTNNGPADATGVSVQDQLPAGLTFVSATPSNGTTYNSGTGVWTIGALPTTAGQNTRTLQIVATVTTTGVNGTITNTATISGLDQFETNLANNTDSEVVTPTQVDLAVVKTVDDATPDKNQNVTFTVTLTNNGPGDATGVQLTDLLPSGLTFVSATPTAGTTYNNATGVWNVGPLPATAGQNTRTLQIVATIVGTGTNGTITNTASVTAVNQFETNTANNQDSESVTPNQLDLVLTKTVDDATPDRNQNITFTVTVTNSGPVDATGVTVSDVLPAGLTFVSASPASGTTFDSATGVWTIGAISATAGQNSKSLQIVATVTSTGTNGTITNTASITNVNQFETTTANNSDSEVVTPNQADLGITKTANPSQLAAGQETVFTLTLTNSGPVEATNVQVTDVLPANLTFVGVDLASKGTYDPATGVWTVGTLSATTGQNTATLQLRARVATGVTLPQTITNTATITSSGPFDPNTSNNTSFATVTPRPLSKRNFLADTAVVP